MKRYFYTLMAVAALLASCEKENHTGAQPELEIDRIETSGHIATIGVSTEAATKAVVSADDNTQVLWEAGDQIVVFANCNADDPLSRSNHSVLYSLQDGAGTASGTFQMAPVPEVQTVDLIYSIVYPESAFEKISGMWGRRDHLYCTIPTVQKARKGSFDKAAAIMYDLPSVPYQKSDLDRIQLKYAVNFLKITVPSGEKVNKIKITSTSALTGEVVLTPSGIEEAEENTENYVILESDNGQELESGEYYIAVRPGTIEAPAIYFLYEDPTNGKATIKYKKGSGAITFAEGKNVKPIGFNSAAVTAHEAVQLWENGPYWATCNIGADAPEADGHYFQWGSLWGYYYLGIRMREWDYNPGEYPGIRLLEYRAGIESTLIRGFSTEFYSNKVSGSTLTSDLDLEHDIAHVKCGEGWRIPSKGEFDALLSEKTEISFTTVNNVNGLLAKGKGVYSSRSIFLPAAGRGDSIRLEAKGGYILYWSRSLRDGERATALYAFYNGQIYMGSEYRYRGLPIRPILNF